VSARGLLGLLCLCGTLARAEAPPASEPESPRTEPPADAPLRANHVVPALEAAALNLGIFAFHNLISGEPFAVVSWDSVRNHLNGEDGWTFDVDKFVTNQFGHPYHGSLTFAAARSSGVPFWQSSLYTFLASLSWEYFAENEPPSINDQITTTLGGVFLGEVLHRTYRFLMDDAGGQVSLPRRLAGVVVSPASSLNDWIFGGQMSSGDIDRAPPLYAELSPGLSLRTRFMDTAGDAPRLLLSQGPQASLAGELVYGAPGDPQWRYRHPFSYFDARAGVTFPGVSTANLYIRGLVAGAQYGDEASAARGLWGLFGLYDFGANDIVRVSSVGLGLGTTLQASLGDKTSLQGTAILAGLGFAAAGSIDLEPEVERARDYHIGPGVQTLLEAKLVRRGLGLLRVRAKNWWVSGVYTEPHQGFESITYVTLEGRARIAHRLAVGLELPLSLRVSDFGPDSRQAIGGSGLLLTLSYMSDDGFGTAGP
jgi:hypothetical protein